MFIINIKITRTMRKIFIILLGIITLLFVSCSKDKGNYYVRYDVSVTSIYIGTMTVAVNTEKGEQSFQSSSKTFSETFGPVDKGFKASIRADFDRPYSELNSNIYVCRGEEPFVLKATGSSTAEYVIDY